MPLKDILECENRKFEKQRIFAVLCIAAFTRNQKENIFQKLIGNSCQMKNASKQCLQLLQRLGVSLVPTTLRADEDKLGSTFMAEFSQRKLDIEEWNNLREILEKMFRKEETQKLLRKMDPRCVKFYDDDFCEALIDIADVNNINDIDTVTAMELAMEHLQLKLYKPISLFVPSY